MDLFFFADLNTVGNQKDIDFFILAVKDDQRDK